MTNNETHLVVGPARSTYCHRWNQDVIANNDLISIFRRDITCPACLDRMKKAPAGR